MTNHKFPLLIKNNNKVNTPLTPFFGKQRMRCVEWIDEGQKTKRESEVLSSGKNNFKELLWGQRILHKVILLQLVNRLHAALHI